MMAPFDRLEAALKGLLKNGCDVDPTVQKLVQEYEKQADEADQLLQEKQSQERNKHQLD